jgi:hypothetical protein
VHEFLSPTNGTHRTPSRQDDDVVLIHRRISFPANSGRRYPYISSADGAFLPRHVDGTR